MILATIEEAWSWTGLSPERILQRNAFGNVIVRATDSRVWRICPEELSCEIIADSERRYDELARDPGFLRDWRMEHLVEVAERRLGPVAEGRCYCLKVPAVLGGEYHESNLATNTVAELLAFSGRLAEQIQDLPDGTQIELVVK